MSTKQCPACGSNDIETQNAKQFFHDYFGGTVEIETAEDQCLICGADGDFDSANDEATKYALETIKRNGAVNIINSFASHGFNLAGIERALELPQRTLSKWRKDTAPTAAGLTLLKFISLFPWLIDVADNHFNYEKSQEICAQAAVKHLCQKETETSTNMSTRFSNGTAIVNMLQVGNVQNHFHIEPSSEGSTTKLVVTG